MTPLTAFIGIFVLAIIAGFLLGSIPLSPRLAVASIVVALVGTVLNVILFVGSQLGDPLVGPDGMRHRALADMWVLWFGLIAAPIGAWHLVDSWARRFTETPHTARGWRSIAAEGIFLSRLLIIAAPSIVALGVIASGVQVIGAAEIPGFLILFSLLLVGALAPLFVVWRTAVHWRNSTRAERQT